MIGFPALFLSHGAPNLILHNSTARDFLSDYGRTIGRPEAIVIVSAHFEAKCPQVVLDPAPDMIYDFRGFEPELSNVVYPAPGAPELAERAFGMLRDTGLEPERVERRGYDHGTWVPLALLYPDADVPVVQISVQPDAGPEHHLALGKALAPLRSEGVLIIGSGAFTHNLSEIFAHIHNLEAAAEPWVKEFADWTSERIVKGDTPDLIAYRAFAPHAERNHPSEEHLLPLFVAMGAGNGDGAVHIHSSAQYGAMMMDAFAFN